MTYVIDIDDTLIWSDKIPCDKCNRITYKIKHVDTDEIERVRKLYERGDRIILYTGRNWDCYEITVVQLRAVGIMYNELVMGKPQGIYIDKDAKTTLEGLA